MSQSNLPSENFQNLSQFQTFPQPYNQYSPQFKQSGQNISQTNLDDMNSQRNLRNFQRSFESENNQLNFSQQNFSRPQPNYQFGLSKLNIQRVQSMNASRNNQATPHVESVQPNIQSSQANYSNEQNYVPQAQQSYYEPMHRNQAHIQYEPIRQNHVNIPIQQQQCEPVRFNQHNSQYGQSQNEPIRYNQANVQNEQPQFVPVQRMRANLPQAQNQGQNLQIEREKPRKTFLYRLNNIPIFNGESFSQLKEFIDVVDSLSLTTKNEAEKNELYEQVLLQLRGEAKTVIGDMNNADWITIKENLLKYFNFLANKEILTSQLENVHQEQNESLNAYADRVRNLLRKKIATYSFVTEDQKLELNRLARKSFSKGLSNMRLRNRLITRGASSLEDAIAYAVEAEYDDMNHISNFELYCTACKSNGHRKKYCRGKHSQNTIVEKLISAIRALNSFPNVNSNFMYDSYEENFDLNHFHEQDLHPNSNWDSNNYSQNGSNVKQFDDDYYYYESFLENLLNRDLDDNFYNDDEPQVNDQNIDNNYYYYENFIENPANRDLDDDFYNDENYFDDEPSYSNEPQINDQSNNYIFDEYNQQINEEYLTQINSSIDLENSQSEMDSSDEENRDSEN